MKATLTASIVTYKNNPDVLRRSIGSFLNSELDVRLFIVDNSPTNELRLLCTDERIAYIFNHENVGFSKGHNIALRKTMEMDSANYHLVLNPDIYFNGPTLEKLVEFMDQHRDVGLVMPKILNPDGSVQHLCKLLPTPYNLILRRFLKFMKPEIAKHDYFYELRFADYDKIMDVPFLSGCFMFLRTSILKEIGLFDERFFMYVEDTDFTRRVHRHYRTVYFPEVHVYHHYAKGSYKSFRLMLHNSKSAITYFNKWGWFNDAERKSINARILKRHLNGKTSSLLQASGHKLYKLLERNDGK